MTNFTQDLFARRRNASDGNTRVVSEGRLWYDSVTNTMRVSDGHTPGGQIVTGQSGSYTLPTATPSVKGGVQLGANIIAAGASIDVLQPTRVSQLENDSNYLSGAVLATYATQTFVTTQGYITSAALISGNANIIAANSTIQSISANLGAYQSYANTSISTLTSNAGVQATAINRIDANLGTATTNISSLVTQANANTTALLAGSVTTGPLTVDSRAGGYFANISGDAHPAYGRQTWKFFSQPNPSGGAGSWILFPDGSTQTTAYPGSSTSLSTFDANLGTLSLGNISTQANLGAYQTWANGRITTLDANLGVRFTTLNTLHANVGAYQTWANGRITTLDANLGTATTNVSNLVTQANANTAAYLTTYTGNITSGNVRTTANITVGGNILVTNGYANVTYTPSTTIGAAYQATVANTQGGTGYADFLRATNTSGGATNPNKTFRLNSTGAMEVINSAYTATLMSISDAGAMSVSGSYQVSGKQAVNGPAFRAYVDTGQAITSGSQQKVTFGTENFDTNSNFASSTFTPTLEGYYQLNAVVRIDGPASTGEIMIVLYKNGAEYARGTNESGTEQGASFYSMQVSDIAYANGTTDYFDIRIQQTSGSNKNTTAGSAISHFSGCMIRGA